MILKENSRIADVQSRMSVTLCDVTIYLSILLLFGSRDSSCVYPGPCTDLTPLYLLNHAVPDRYSLPPGVEIVYDPEHRVHSYHFTPDVTSLAFPSSAVFKYCRYFPEEFSLLVTLKVGEQTRSRRECLVSLIQRGGRRTLLGLRLDEGRIQFDYTDRLTGRRRVTKFAGDGLFDGQWHTVVVVVTGYRISLSLDCGRPRRTRLRRSFPALVDTRNTNIHIGECNAGPKRVFTGLLKELILLPGRDITPETCPPRLPEVAYPKPGFPPEAANMLCTWRDTGKLTFDVYRKSLHACYSGVWQTVYITREPKPATDRMDYIVWHQDIIMAAPTIDLEVFRIPGEGLFMAAASFDNSDLKKQQSAILKWERGNFRLYQSLYTLGAQGWEHFQIGKMFFLAVANLGSRRDKPSKSVIYKWSRRKKRFESYQELITWTARDIEYFRVEGSHYLAVANHVRGQNHSIESVILKWSEMERKFKQIQSIVTTGAYDWTHFTVDSYNLLVVANSYSGPPQSTTKLHSEIYFWQEGQLLPFQKLETTGATDWESFTINGEFFLVVANAYNYGSHVSNETERYRTNSTIYKLDVLRKRFEVYQEILTYSAVDWEYFKVGDDHYLIVSNAQQDGATVYGPQLSSTRSAIYRWQGVEKFVPVHYLDSLPSADWEVFVEDETTYLAYANANDNISQVYKVKLV